MASKMSVFKPLQGEIWLFDPDPVKGNEIGKKIRLGVVISHSAMNTGPSGLLFIVPLTSIDKGIESHIRIDPPIEAIAKVVFDLSRIDSFSSFRPGIRKKSILDR
jgi:mRNA-degrading endonuclease toxin of MazEF toxin-antitoxin module